MSHRPPGHDQSDTPTGIAPRRLGRRAFIGGSAGLAAGLALWPGSVGAVEPGASYFVPMAPTRVCDTRIGFGYRPIDANTIRVGLGGYYGVPSDAVAVVMTLTGVNLVDGGNWLSAYPAGTGWPGTASSNSEYFWQAVANLVTVRLGRGGDDANGAVDVRSLDATYVVADICGYYMPAPAPVRAGRLEMLVPVRVVDTRGGAKPVAGQVIPVNLNGVVPADAAAVVANVTAVDTVDGGFVTTYPLGAERPTASSLNYAANEVRGSSVIAKLGFGFGMTGFNLYSMSGAHLVVDVVGYFTGPSAALSDRGLFVPVNPVRLLDTRATARRVWPGGTTTFSLPEPMRSRARSVAMNLAVTSTIGPGFFTAFAAQTTRRLVSSLNSTRPGQTIANHAITGVSPAGVSCFVQNGAHVIGDVSGWFTGGPEPVTTAPPINPPPPAVGPPWILQVPTLGLGQWVLDGDAKRIVDSGNTWHWAGTGLVGQGTTIVVFGHRTTAGGPYRNQHLLRGGDLLYVTTTDGRRYTYQMVAEAVTSKSPNEILATCGRVGGETLSLVACSKPNRLPTSLEYRLISTFRLLGWDDLG